MKNSTTLKDYAQNTSSYKQTVGARCLNKARFFYAVIFLLLLPTIVNAQINEFYNFNNTLQSWVSTGSGSFSQSNTQSCDGIGSARANVYYNATNAFMSPLLGTATGEMVTVVFDYKVLNYYAHIPTLGSELEIKAQWSNSTAGPWTTFATINSQNHIPAQNCLTKTESFTPTAGNLYVRFQNRAIGQNTDIYFYYDNITIIEGVIPTCLPVESVSVPPNLIGTNSLTATWVAPLSAPSLGYEYEVRRSGAAGSGVNGLAANGSVGAGVTIATIDGLQLSTIYTVFIRGKCGNSEFSTWRASSPLITLCGVETVPYSIPFSTAVVPGLPNCISIQNVNADPKTWKSHAGTPGITGKVMQYSYSATLVANDWFYTSALHLDAGVSYRLTFKYKGTGFEEQLLVAFGNSAAASSMINVLDDIFIAETSTDAVLRTIDFTPQTSGTYYLGFQAHSDENQNSIFVGEVALDFAPSCLPPLNVEVSNIGKHSAKFSWTASISNSLNAYQYEIRTSGLPGSGEQGLVNSAVLPPSTISVVDTTLMPSTTYRIYFASDCSNDDQSIWTAALRFRTFCDYDDIEGVDDFICAGTTATLQVTGVEDEVNWYSTTNSEQILGSGPIFTTPELATTKSYYAKAFSINQAQLAFLGNAAEVSDSYQNPFYSLWSNSHTQHIIPASELKDAGLTAGPILSVALSVVNAGTLPMKNLSVKIGTTTNTDLANFVNNEDFQLVFSSPSFMPVVGMNILQFSSPYQWDGESNLVLEFCHANPESLATMTRSVLADNTNYLSSVKTNATTLVSTDVVCANTTASKMSYSQRPFFVFRGAILCANPNRTKVTATVTPLPEIVAESQQIINADAQEDATLADLEPSSVNVNWYATEQKAMDNSDPLLITTQLVSGTTYYAVLTENACRSLPFAVTATVVLGTKSQTLEGLKYHPNPVQNQLSLSYFQNIESIEVFNLIGQKVLALKPHSTDVQLDMSMLPPATYLVQINTENASKIIKVIKQ